MKTAQKAIALFDQYNKQDPQILEFNGLHYPAEYFYALQLYNWVRKLKPDASEHLVLASRSQHIGRWKAPLSSFPVGKTGYLIWRRELAKFHAKTAGELMFEAGYDEEDVKEVQQIILKENLRHDKQVQVIENALCLVFLQFQFKEFLNKHNDDEMVIRILRKTWNKMTEPGRDAALQLSYCERGKDLLLKALQ